MSSSHDLIINEDIIDGKYIVDVVLIKHGLEYNITAQCDANRPGDAIASVVNKVIREAYRSKSDPYVYIGRNSMNVHEFRLEGQTIQTGYYTINRAHKIIGRLIEVYLSTKMRGKSIAIPSLHLIDIYCCT